MITSEYAAGFFDGEGSIKVDRIDKRSRLGARFDYYKVSASAGQTSLHILKELQTKYGGSVCKQKVYKVHHRPFWNWLVVSQQALTFLRDIIPFLVVKKGQVELAIQLQETFRMGGRHRVITPREDRARYNLYLKIRSLSKKGTAKVSIGPSFEKVVYTTIVCKAPDCDTKIRIIKGHVGRKVKKFCSTQCYKRTWMRNKRIGSMKEIK